MSIATTTRTKRSRPGMPRFTQHRRLTDEQRDMADRHIPAAMALAGSMSAGMTTNLRDEVEAAALFGLADAAGLYDPGLGFRFWTHAKPRVRGAILDWMRGEMLKGYRRVAGRCPRPAMVSMDFIVADDGDGRAITLSETLAADEDEPGELCDAGLRIAAILRSLPPQHRQVMTMLHTRADCLTLSSVGRVLGLSESRICDIKAESIEIIRENLQRKELVA